MLQCGEGLCVAGDHVVASFVVAALSIGCMRLAERKREREGMQSGEGWCSGNFRSSMPTPIRGWPRERQGALSTESVRVGEGTGSGAHANVAAANKRCGIVSRLVQPVYQSLREERRTHARGSSTARMLEQRERMLE